MPLHGADRDEFVLKHIKKVPYIPDRPMTFAMNLLNTLFLFQNMRNN